MPRPREAQKYELALGLESWIVFELSLHFTIKSLLRSRKQEPFPSEMLKKPLKVDISRNRKENYSLLGPSRLGNNAVGRTVKAVNKVGLWLCTMR